MKQVLLCAVLLAPHAILANPVTSQQTTPQGAQVAPINNAVAFAQNTINQMPQGPGRDQAQRALDNFKKALADGKVKVANGAAGIGALGAGTSPENRTGDGGWRGTSGVGVGGEQVLLGNDLTGKPDGSAPVADPYYTGGHCLHEGARLTQEWTSGSGGEPRNPGEFLNYWLNEIAAYWLGVLYFQTLQNTTADEVLAAKYGRHKNDRLKRIAYAQLMILLGGP